MRLCCFIMVLAVNDPTLKEKVDLEKSWRCGDVQPITLGDGGYPSFCAMKRNNMIGVGGMDGLQIWDMSKREIVKVLKMEGPCSSVCLLEDVVLAGDEDGDMYVWRMDGNVLLSQFEAHCGPISCIVGVRDVVATVGEDGLSLWRQGTWECEYVLEENYVQIISLASAYDGKYLLVGDLYEGIRVWNISTRRCVQNLEGYASGATRLCVHESSVLSGTKDNGVKVWSLEDGTCKQTFPTPEKIVLCMAVDADRIALGLKDRKRVDLSTNLQRCFVEIWDIVQGDLIRTFDINDTPVGVWLRRSELSVVAFDGKIIIWDFLSVCWCYGVTHALQLDFGMGVKMGV
ncbi:hypothetical protein BSKO_02480 [Bryopsis sp. KO-2023]|nr:hypothetical protein BSKO_02480 [Bryopsis sp. KO-2023]